MTKTSIKYRKPKTYVLLIVTGFFDILSMLLLDSSSIGLSQYFILQSLFPFIVTEGPQISCDEDSRSSPFNSF